MKIKRVSAVSKTDINRGTEAARAAVEMQLSMAESLRGNS